MGIASDFVLIVVAGLGGAILARTLGLPLLVWMFVVVAVIGWVVLNRTTYGRRTFALGGNPEAARLAGVNTRLHTMSLYVLSGFCAGVAAIMIAGQTTSGSSTNGTGYELNAIAAVIEDPGNVPCGEWLSSSPWSALRG